MVHGLRSSINNLRIRIALILVSTLCMSVLSGISSSQATILIGDDYPFRVGGPSPAVGCTDGWCVNGRWYSNYKFAYRNCTDFVAWRLNSANGVNFTNQYANVPRWGNAKEWWAASLTDSAKAQGVRADDIPVKGAVAWQGTGDFGHVAWVADVSGGNVTIEEYNINWTGAYRARTVPATQFRYIHVRDLANDPHGNVDNVSSPHAGKIKIWGWAFDADSASTPINIHVYVGGPAGSGAPGYDTGVTAVARPDVLAGGSPGFDVDVWGSWSGTLPVFVYGINIGGGTNALIGSTTVTVAASSEPKRMPGTSHWYQVIYGKTKWSDALSGAKARTQHKMAGHLATVTSKSEFDFIRSLEWYDRLWLGARDAGPSGGAARTWKWIDGPEKGNTFTTCVKSTARTSCKAVGNSFTKWLPTQPDNWTPGESFMELSKDGWNDCSDLCGSGVGGYVVEFEPISTSVSASLPSRGTAGVKFSLTGKVIPNVSVGKVQLVWKYKINGKYVAIEKTSGTVSQGKFKVAKILKRKGAWQVTAKYLGSGATPVSKASKSVSDFIIIQ